MEIEYIEKKIKNELINKDFKLWNKESIDLLLSVFENEKYNKFFNINLLLLDDYIKWYSKNKDEIIDNYSLENLQGNHTLIKNNINCNYTGKIDEDLDLFSYFSGVFYEYIFVICIVLYVIISFIISLLKVKDEKKKEEKNYIYEVKIPFPNELLNNPLVKLLGENIFYK